jgi:hypothetical protein
MTSDSSSDSGARPSTGGQCSPERYALHFASRSFRVMNLSSSPYRLMYNGAVAQPHPVLGAGLAQTAGRECRLWAAVADSQSLAQAVEELGLLAEAGWDQMRRGQAVRSLLRPSWETRDVAEVSRGRCRTSDGAARGVATGNGPYCWHDSGPERGIWPTPCVSPPVVRTERSDRWERTLDTR